MRIENSPNMYQECKENLNAKDRVIINFVDFKLKERKEEKYVIEKITKDFLVLRHSKFPDNPFYGNTIEYKHIYYIDTI